MSYRIAMGLLCAAGAVLMSTLAQADVITNVQVRDSATNDSFYVPGVKASSLKAKVNGSWKTLPTGAFSFEADYGLGFQGLITYCIEPNKILQVPANPNNNTGLTHQFVLAGDYAPFTSTELDILGKLYANAFGDSLTSTKKSAAFQSLLWEMNMDDSLDFGNGNFKLSDTNSWTLDVEAIANDWLNKINTNVWTTSVPVNFLVNANSQNLITPVTPGEIPEPASLAMVGLGALLMIRRK